MTDTQGEACLTKIPWTHRGPLHSFTGCWHYGGERQVVIPGHGVVNDRQRQMDVSKCCICLQEEVVPRASY